MSDISHDKGNELRENPFKLRDEAVQRVFEDTMFALGGPQTRANLCDNSKCITKEPQADKAVSILFDDMEKLAKLDKGFHTKAFQADLHSLNTKLTYQGFPMSIAGVDKGKRTITIKGTDNNQYGLKLEDGLTTMFAMRTSGMWSDRVAAKKDTSVRLDSIKADDVNQGNLSDCYFMATASVLAAMQPQTIRDMIVDHHNGKFTVTFPGDAKHPVTVDRPNRAERSQLNTTEQDIHWADILEKAHRKQTGRSLFDPEGSQEAALHLLTGKEAISAHMSEQRTRHAEDVEQDVAKLLKLAMDAKSPLIAASPHSGMSGSDATIADGITLAHSYAVLGYDEQTQTVTMRNPKGTNSENKEKFEHIRPGVFKMPLKNFIADFWDISMLKEIIPKS